ADVFGRIVHIASCLYSMKLPSIAHSDKDALKLRVKTHWENAPCGTRYSDETDRRRYFDNLTTARYKLEPYIPTFADFPSARGKLVLEIGVGAGADFQNWCNHATHATGIDLTEKAIALVSERLHLNDVPAD